MLETNHRVVHGDARSMDALDDASVQLVVTSPPYPMIGMWDPLFAELAPASGPALDAGRGDEAFEAMHAALDEVWAEVERVLVPGGTACVNVGDAVRTVDGTFQLYPNHARIQQALVELGLTPLPGILWRKPATSPTKFMGSGMLPPRAYATLEHEHILVLRKPGERRIQDEARDRRYESAYFWEERNRWFTDLWTDVRGELQTLGDQELRERSAAFPFELAYRLVNMFSIQGDVVLDPFWGTGTTSLAALVAARSSVGYELDEGFTRVFDERIQQAPALSRQVVEQRLEDHRAFVQRRTKEGKPPGHENEHYGFPVTTKQETELRFHVVDELQPTDEAYRAQHTPFPA